MFIIGERINGMFRSVARAIQERDEGAIADLARRQVNAGANALDLNTGPTEGDPAEVMAWLVRTAQDAVDVHSRSTARSPRSSRRVLPPPAGTASSTRRRAPRTVSMPCFPWRPSTTPG